MPRTKSPNPKYRFHVSGQAAVRLDYKDFYLGEYDSPASYARYHSLLAEYNSNGRKAPDVATQQLGDEPIKVKHVTADYRALMLDTYADNYAENNRLVNLLNLLDSEHGEEPADSFGPIKLKNLRDGFILHGLGGSPCCRKYCNYLTKLVVDIVEHGVSRELVRPEQITALKTLKPLKRNQARDNPKRTGVDVDAVKQTLPHLDSVVSDMVRIQLATAMRPSELFSMTPADIDRSGEVWFYRPKSHKTEHHGKAKAIPLVGEVVKLLSVYLFGDPGEPCFTTNKGTPWNKDTYRRHITRACQRHELKRWTPYQLRHTAAQIVRDKAGAEAAQALLGHAKIDTTEIYAKASEMKAIEGANAAPSLS